MARLGQGLSRLEGEMPTGTISPSDKPIEMPACQVVKVEGAKVQSVNHYFDLATMLRQIGAFKG